jgi:hypothetical protein
MLKRKKMALVRRRAGAFFIQRRGKDGFRGNNKLKGRRLYAWRLEMAYANYHGRSQMTMRALLQVQISSTRDSGAPNHCMAMIERQAFNRSASSAGSHDWRLAPLKARNAFGRVEFYLTFAERDLVFGGGFVMILARVDLGSGRGLALPKKTRKGKKNGTHEEKGGRGNGQADCHRQGCQGS